MNNYLYNFLATLFLALLLGLFLPWWSIMISALLVSLAFPLKSWLGFLIPFASILVLWASYALMLTSSNDFILSNKIGVLFNLGPNGWLVIIVSAIIGGIAAGFSGLLGSQIRNK